jgi:predicted RNA-binding Zn ribbon-like protein
VEPSLLGNHLALDFVATVGERSTTWHERLARPADLDQWLRAAGVVDKPVGATAADLDAARELREAIYALLRAATTGSALPRTAVQVVNRAGTTPPPIVRLTTSGHVQRSGTAAAARAELARAAVDLIGGADLSRVRWCADTTCTRPFLDRSRAGGRRWCGMAGCGDRAKARAYRSRRRAQPPD